MLAASAVALLLGGCASTLVDVPRLPSFAFDRPEATSLGRSIRAQLASTPDRSGVHLLASGLEAFQVRAALAELAERTLDLQYYIVADDATATLLIYRALLAAERGVRVRILVDDWYSHGRDPEFAQIAALPNVQVRVFNPFRIRTPFRIARLLELLGDSARLNRRMHNKLWIADNAAAVIGGRNLADNYFEANGENDFADLDLLAAGPAVAEISNSFDEYWNSEWSVPILPAPDATTGARAPLMTRLEAVAARFRGSDYAHALRGAGVGKALRDGTLPLIPAALGVLYDSPGKNRPDPSREPSALAPIQRKLIEGAEREVVLISPYFIPSERGIAVLGALVRRGVRVRVLTNSLASTDVPVVHAGYARYRGRLLANGVELYEHRPRQSQPFRVQRTLSSGASLHAKAAVIDRRTVIVGSMNLDPRSRLWNTEAALLVESPELGEQLAALFEEAAAPEAAFHLTLAESGSATGAVRWVTTENGEIRRYDSEPLASWWRRLLSHLLGLLAPEDLL